MLIFRYLAKEVFIVLLALTTIIMVIFLSNQLVVYLGRVASGKIPLMLIFQILLVEIPYLLGLLIPLGFFIALLLAYGRFYADSEMLVLQACGFSFLQLLRYTLVLALIVASLCACLVFWVAPNAWSQRQMIAHQGGLGLLFKTLTPEKFRTIEGGKKVIYINDINREHSRADGVFIAQKKHNKGANAWEIIRADKASLEFDSKVDREVLKLDHGFVYQGSPGEKRFSITSFLSFKYFLQPLLKTERDDVRTLKTSALLPIHNPDKDKMAELQWRISIPVMVMVLAMLALPLSRVHPREGKFAKLLPAVILFMFYGNFMFVGRDWLAAGSIPWWAGLWWLHGSLLLLAIGLIAWAKFKKQ